MEVRHSPSPTLRSHRDISSAFVQCTRDYWWGHLAVLTGNVAAGKAHACACQLHVPFESPWVVQSPFSAYVKAIMVLLAEIVPDFEADTSAGEL